MFFLMMDTPNAAICSILVCISLYITYRYSLRIYNRFYWDKSKTQWKDHEEDPEYALNELNPVISKSNNSSIDEGRKKKKVTWSSSSQESSLNTGLLSGTQTKPSKTRKLFSNVFSKNSENSADNEEMSNPILQYNPNDLSIYGDEVLPDGSYVDIEDFKIGHSSFFKSTIGGYLTLKGKKSYGREPWERQYFVVKATLIYYYKDKRSFEMNPSMPINRRPIDLEGYALVAGTVEPPYIISLVPIDPDDIRKTWKFRCDTLGEFKSWIQIFSEALKLSNKDLAESDIIRVNKI